MIEEPKLLLMVLLFLLLIIYKYCFEDVFERQLKRVSIFCNFCLYPTIPVAYVESWEQPTKKSTVTLHNLRIKYGKLVLLDEAEDCEEEEGAEAEELVTRQIEQVK